MQHVLRGIVHVLCTLGGYIVYVPYTMCTGGVWRLHVQRQREVARTEKRNQALI